MFRRVVHCDWSKHPGGRWSANAVRVGAGWRADGPSPVPSAMDAFVADLLDAEKGPTLAAFDFPIGLPALLRGPMGGGTFPDALARLGAGVLVDALRPATAPGEVGPLRPFYPAKPGGARQSHLVTGLGAGSMADLLRDCERGGAGKPYGGCMLWLVGAKTVGKAAIHGWTEVVLPARAMGARLWPFDGDLATLAAGGAPVLAESYPAQAVVQLGLEVKNKNAPAALAAVAAPMLAWAAARGIALSATLEAAIRGGFSGMGSRAGDAFDAVAGLLAAVAVATGEQAPCPPLSPLHESWEGWILGRPG